MVRSIPATWQELFDIVSEESKEYVASGKYETYIADRIQQGQQYFRFM